MINGYMNEDLFSLDIKRFQKFHSSKKFIMERVTETLGDLYTECIGLINSITLQEIKDYYRIIKN